MSSGKGSCIAVRIRAIPRSFGNFFTYHIILAVLFRCSYFRLLAALLSVAFLLGLQALIFTAEGDMRNALNNLQSTHAGFGVVNDENVFKVCDQPHPLVVKKIVASCQEGDVRSANAALETLWHDGYSAIDIIGVFFRIVK